MAFVLRRLVPLVLLALLWAPAAYAWSWPVQGPVLQQFSFDHAHPYAAGQRRGIDVGAPADGGPVVAPAAGTVTFAGSVPTSGTSLTILTADGYSVTLTHLGALAVARGATVVEGDAVGTVGQSGTPDFDVPYVHLGIRLASDPNGYLDPLTLLPAPAPAPVASPGSSVSSAGSSAPPAQTTSAPTAPAPAAPIPVAVPVPVAGAGAPSATEPVRAPEVPIAQAPAAPPVVRAAGSRPSAAHAKSAPAAQESRRAAQARPPHAHDHARQVVPIGDGALRARSVPRPQPVAVAPVRPRPAPLPSSERERPAAGADSSPVLLLALGAGAVMLAAATLLGLVALRRRPPAAPPEVGAVVIPLRQGAAGLQERRVA